MSYLPKHNSEFGDGYRQGVIDTLAMINSVVDWETDSIQQLRDVKEKLTFFMDMYGQHIKPIVKPDGEAS